MYKEILLRYGFREVTKNVGKHLAPLGFHEITVGQTSERLEWVSLLYDDSSVLTHALRRTFIMIFCAQDKGNNTPSPAVAPCSGIVTMPIDTLFLTFKALSPSKVPPKMARAIQSTSRGLSSKWFPGALLLLSSKSTICIRRSSSNQTDLFCNHQNIYSTSTVRRLLAFLDSHNWQSICYVHLIVPLIISFSVSDHPWLLSAQQCLIWYHTTTESGLGPTSSETMAPVREMVTLLDRAGTNEPKLDASPHNVMGIHGGFNVSSFLAIFLGTIAMLGVLVTAWKLGPSLFRSTVSRILRPRSQSYSGVCHKKAWYGWVNISP